MRLLSASHAPVHRRAATTLTEIIAVIAIITTLSSFSFYAFSSAKQFADGIEQQANAALMLVNHHMGKDPKGSSSVTTSTPTVAKPRPTRVPGEYYIGFQPSVQNPEVEAQRLAKAVGGTVMDVFTVGIYGFSLKCSDAKVNLIGSDPAVALIDQMRCVYPCAAAPLNIQRVFSNGFNGNQITAPGATTKTYGVPTSVYLFNPAVSTLYQVTSRTFVPSSAVGSIVAIMDTGIDSTHPDLNVVYEQDFTNNNDTTDTDGHGTHIAGVVAARDQTAAGGVVGVAPGAPLMNLKVMNGTKKSTWFGTGNASDTFNGSASAVYRGLNYVIANAAGISVCLMPFETTLDAQMNTLVATAASKGVMMVAPAGNNFTGFPQNFANVSPASSSGAIVVGAIFDQDGLPNKQGANKIFDDTPADYTNTGNVDFVAPGGDRPTTYNLVPGTNPGFYQINSTIPLLAMSNHTPVLTTPYDTFINGDNTSLPTLPAVPVNPAALGRPAYGTSFAAAHVAGMLALLSEPSSTIGMLQGGRAVTAARSNFTTRSGAITALMSATHNSTPFQMISPLTGSAWVRATTFPFAVTAYKKTLFNDRVGGRPVANFYVNDNQFPTFLPKFPG